MGGGGQSAGGADHKAVSSSTCQNGSTKKARDFPGGLVVKNPYANAGDMGSTSGAGRFHIPQGNEHMGHD